MPISTGAQKKRGQFIDREKLFKSFEELKAKKEKEAMQEEQSENVTPPVQSQSVPPVQPKIVQQNVTPAQQPQVPPVAVELDTPVKEETKEALNIIQEAKKEQIQKLEEQVLSADVTNDALWIPIPKLPSNNKVFPSENTVFYRRYDFNDFEFINNADLLPQQRFRLMLKGIKTQALSSTLLLPFYDFTAIGFIRKLESQGPDRKFAVPYQCAKCGQIGVHNFQLSDLDLHLLEVTLPIKVRFYSYPDKVFEFSLFTIGDALFLLDNDLFYSKLEDGSYLRDVTNSPIPDKLATLAVSCINFEFGEAYELLKNINDGEDYNTLNALADMLRCGIRDINFKCQMELPATDKNVEALNEEKLQALKDWNGRLPPLLQYKLNKGLTCNNEISIDVLGGDIIFLPFRESDKSSEYGILAG